MSVTATLGSWRSALATAATAAALVLPFAGKPLHIDDPFYVWVAQQIRAHPADFFGASVNWYGTEQSLARVNQNPPLASYFIALWALAFGWSELALHLGFLLPAVGLALGIHALARRWTTRPRFAALAAFATPVVLVSATTLMSDTLMLAFYCWAIFFWVRGIDTDRFRDLAIGALLVAPCALTKYFGMTLIPLLAVYALAVRRRAGAYLLLLLLPVAVLVGYELYTAALYGEGQILAASRYALKRQNPAGQTSAWRWLPGLVYAGGCTATLLAFVPFAASRRAVAVGAAAATALGGLALGAAVTRSTAGAVGWEALAHVGVFGLAAAALAGVMAAELRSRRDAVTRLLVLWVAGTFVFAALLNWSTSGRSVLPMAPALALLVTRRIERADAPWRVATRPRLGAALACGAAVSLAVAGGDYAFAAAARDAAARIHEHHPDARIWFVGHWGFQHYMQLRGARAVDYRASVIEAGDLVAAPESNTNSYPPAAGTADLVERIELPQTGVAWTMSNGAGFYSTVFGALPYRIGRPGPQSYWVFRARRAFRFRPPRGTWPALAARLARARDWPGVLAAYEASGRAHALGSLAVRARYALGERDRAAAAIAELTGESPRSAALRRKLGHAALDAGDAATAAALYREALALDPDRADTLNDLAWLLATASDPAVRNPAAAVGLAERAVRAGAHPDANRLDTLAAAYAAAGRIDDATATLAAAAAAAEESGDPDAARAFGERSAALRARATRDARCRSRRGRECE